MPVICRNWHKCCAFWRKYAIIYAKTHTMKLPKARKRGDAYRIELMFDGKRYSATALLHKDLKCKAPLIELNLRRNLGKWST